MGPPEGRAVGRVNRQSPQGFAGGQGLFRASLGEAGEVIAALDAVLEVEAAQAVANQQDPEGHGHVCNEKASYWSALLPLPEPTECLDLNHGAVG